MVIFKTGRIALAALTLTISTLGILAGCGSHGDQTVAAPRQPDIAQQQKDMAARRATANLKKND